MTAQSGIQSSSEKRSPKSVPTRSDGRQNLRNETRATGPLRLEDDSQPMGAADVVVVVVEDISGPLDQDCCNHSTVLSGSDQDPANSLLRRPVSRHGSVQALQNKVKLTRTSIKIYPYKSDKPLTILGKIAQTNRRC